MTHRWGLLDVQLWRRLADVAVWCADDMERRGEVRGKRIADLRVAVKRAYKAKFPAPEADWPRFSLFLRLAEDFAGGADDWRKAWTAALDTSARAILARLDGREPPAPSAAAAQAAGGRPWWTDGK